MSCLSIIFHFCQQNTTTTSILYILQSDRLIVIRLRCIAIKKAKLLHHQRFVCDQHQTEMELIMKYSPFKTEAQFMKEFDKIESVSGSLVIVYNLKLLDSGLPELDVRSEAHDILLSHPEIGSGNTDDGLV